MNKSSRIIVLICLISIFFFIITFSIPYKQKADLYRLMIKASETMDKAVRTIRNCREEKGIGINKEFDINQTGIIGRENSVITTSIGSLEAKRTTTNPNFAGLLVGLMHEAGVKPGDAVALEASGSFPGLIIAVFSAAKTMDLKLIYVVSMGASQWGANEPDFNWLKMKDCLLENEIFDFEPAAVSLGGEYDVGEGMDAEGRIRLLQSIRESGVLFVYQSDLKRNVEQKISIFKKEAGEKRITAFINIGGSYSGLGIDSDILKVKPGLTDIKSYPPLERRGLVFEMAARGYPVIHLLYINGIVQEYGLPWDPVPLPEPGKGAVYEYAKGKSWEFFLLALGYFTAVAAVIRYGFYSHSSRSGDVSAGLSK
ncbi:MAG TPA: poly-gamma-glutamate system protein [Candidatus Aminicenantes bacterium]|nr:poly-gamma-glutamate system protein [Candidatus Aminicenantes bacterium]